MFKFIEAKTIADIVDPSTTLGIEITDPDVATRCKLGNLDGQHVRRVDWMAGLAAIEIAMRIDLDASLAGQAGPPRPGSNLPTLIRSTTTLATTRPDVDSVGAMAVLVLRALGLAVDNEFVRTVVKADSFRAGAWSPKPLPTEENPWPTGTTTVDSTQSLAGFGMICSPRPTDRTRALSLAQRVFLMAIRLTGSEGLRAFGQSAPYVEEYAGLSDSSRGDLRLAEILGIHPLFEGRGAVMYIGGLHNEAHVARQELARAAREPGAVTIRDLWWCQSIDERLMPHRGPFASEADAIAEIDSMDLSADRDMCTVKRSKFVVVRVAHAGALSLGYCLAPVVVAFDQAATKWFVEEWRGELGWRPPFGASPASDEKHRTPCDSHSAAERLSWEFSEELQSIGSPAPTTRVVSRSSKVTIAAYTDGHLDTVGLTSELNRLEEAAGGTPKWGGPRNMCCSPSHVGTRLAEETISGAVSRFAVRQ